MPSCPKFRKAQEVGQKELDEQMELIRQDVRRTRELLTTRTGSQLEGRPAQAVPVA